jgi:hypothetical protein
MQTENTETLIETEKPLCTSVFISLPQCVHNWDVAMMHTENTKSLVKTESSIPTHS